MMIECVGENEYKTKYRGSSYYLNRDPRGTWSVWTQRDALRAARMGGSIKCFVSLAEVSRSVKAFKGIDLLVDLPSVSAITVEQ